MSKALIIGGTGFLGRTLQREARDAGYETIVFGPGPLPQAADRDNDAILGDVCQPEELDHALNLVRPDVVFHLAAFGVGGEGLIRSAELDPFQATRVNVLGFVASRQLADKHRVKHFVWSSSTSVYGPMSRHGIYPVDEDVAPQPDTIYGTTKVACERLAAVLPTSSLTRSIGLRLVAIYGAGRYPGAMAAFTRFVTDVAGGRPTALTANTTPADWIHVVDAARAMLLAASIPNPSRLVYNVVGHRSTLEEMARRVATHATAPTDVTVGPGPDDPPTLLDDARFRNESGFSPLYDLLSGAEDYVSSTRKEPIPWQNTPAPND